MRRVRILLPLALGAAALSGAFSATAAASAAPGTGMTVAFGLSRSGSAGVAAGACGTRLACFKSGISEASVATSALVENSALVMINVADADQDVNLKLAGKQLLIAPDADPNGNGKPDYLDAVAKLSLGGGTCFTCALQAAERSFETARSSSTKVIVLVSERENVFRSTGFTSSGLPTGYPAMELSQMSGHFDANTVVRAFAVGPQTSCSHDPNGIGSLAATAAATPGGTCTNVASFEGLGPILSDAVSGGGSLPPPDVTAPAVTLTAPADGASFLETEPALSGTAGTASGDEPSVTVTLWHGTDTSVAPAQTRVTTQTAGAYEVHAAPALAPGIYTVQAEQRDTSGNVGRSAAVRFTVEAPEPPPDGAEAYVEAVRHDGPRAYWRLGEIAGLVAVEDGGHANGMYVGGVLLGVAPAIDAADHAARFDGGNDKVTVADPADGRLDFGVDDFTIEAWIRPSASDERVIVSKRSTNSAEPHWALTVSDDPNHNGQVRAAYGDGTNSRVAYSSSSLLDGRWHHVVAWYDRDTGITLWVDGVAKSTALAISPDVSNTGELLIGKSPANTYFKGDVDEVALYTGLLPATRITAHRTAATTAP